MRKVWEYGTIGVVYRINYALRTDLVHSGNRLYSHTPILPHFSPGHALCTTCYVPVKVLWIKMFALLVFH